MNPYEPSSSQSPSPEPSSSLGRRFVYHSAGTCVLCGIVWLVGMTREGRFAQGGLTVSAIAFTVLTSLSIGTVLAGLDLVWTLIRGRRCFPFSNIASFITGFLVLAAVYLATTNLVTEELVGAYRFPVQLSIILLVIVLMHEIVSIPDHFRLLASPSPGDKG